MNIILDARSLRYYPVSTPGFTGATEMQLHRLASGLASRGHEVHVVTADSPLPQHRDANLWYWPPEVHPTVADAVIAFHNLANVYDYQAPLLLLASNGPDPYLAGQEANVDAFVCFSETHVKLLCETNPTIPKEKCRAIGLGADTPPFTTNRVPGRLLWASDPVRGLWHLLDVYEELRKLVPEASLHIAYDFNKKFTSYEWAAHSVAQALWDCKRRIETTPGITNLGALLHGLMAKEQLECDVFAYPCDPITPGSELFCVSAMEAAAAGCPLVLSDSEALPEVYGKTATILPVPGAFLPEAERRCDARDWAEKIASLMKDERLHRRESKKSRTLAAKHSWDSVVVEWEALLTGMRAKVTV